MPTFTQVRYGSQTPTSGESLLFVFAKWEAQELGGGIFSVDTGTEVISTGATPHLFIPGMAVRFYTSGGSTLPSGLVAGTNYFVLTTPDEFTLTVSLTVGGATVNIGAGLTGNNIVSGWEEDATQWEIETTEDGSSWDPAQFVIQEMAYLADLTITPALAIRVRVSEPWVGEWTEQTLEFPIILGPDTVDCELGVRPMARMQRSNTAAELPGQWDISGEPAGVDISNDDEPIAGYLGGKFTGAPSEEGEFPAVVTWVASSDPASNETFDAKRVLFRVNGPTYIADFHEDRSRTGVLIDIHTGAAGGWQFVGNALLVEYGDEFTLHAVLRDGAGYVASGVTDLELVAKLPDMRDGAPLFKFTSATPAVDTYGLVKAWPLAAVWKSTVLEKLFEKLNYAATGVAASASVTLNAQFAWTHGGRRRRSAVFAISVKQPLVMR